MAETPATSLLDGDPLPPSSSLSGTISLHTISILAMSDTEYYHCFPRSMPLIMKEPGVLPEVDVLIHCGGLCHGTPTSICESVEWIWNVRATIKLVIAGDAELNTINAHLGPDRTDWNDAEMLVENHGNPSIRLLEQLGQVRVLKGGYHTIALPDGRSFSIFVTPCLHAGFYLNQNPWQGLYEKHWEQVDRKVDIMVTRGIGDIKNLPSDADDVYILPGLQAACQRAKPKLHCCAFVETPGSEVGATITYRDGSSKVISWERAVYWKRGLARTLEMRIDDRHTVVANVMVRNPRGPDHMPWLFELEVE